MHAAAYVHAFLRGKMPRLIVGEGTAESPVAPVLLHFRETQAVPCRFQGGGLGLIIFLFNQSLMKTFHQGWGNPMTIHVLYYSSYITHSSLHFYIRTPFIAPCTQWH